MSRFTHSGNSKHYATPAYRHSPRIPGPIEGMDYPRFNWRTLFKKEANHG